MTGPDPAVGPPSPADLRMLSRNVETVQAFAESVGDDPAAPHGSLITGFQITDLRRFLSQLGEAEACEDYPAEQVARALIAGYVRAALRTHDTAVEHRRRIEAAPLLTREDVLRAFDVPGRIVDGRPGGPEGADPLR